MAGLPARYVEGYLAEPNENGEALVTGLDAHAWTEVYFSGFGWLTFDATPGQHTSGRQQGTSGGATPPTPSPEPTAATPTPEPKETESGKSPEPTPEDKPEDIPEEGTDGSTPAGSSESPSEAPTEIPSESPEEKPDGLPEDEPNAENSHGEADKNGSFPWWLLIIAGFAALAGVRGWMTSPGCREKHADT